MSFSHFPTTTKLREEQKRSVNHFTTKIGSTKQHDGIKYKKDKYWCPVMKDDYLATPLKVVCPLCKEKHPFIKFDRKKHV